MSARRRKNRSGTEAQRVVGDSLPRYVVTLLYPAILLLAAYFLAVHPITDPDFWYHAAFGREVLANGALPRFDPFTHTAVGHYYVSSGWLPDILLHLYYSSGGALQAVLFVWLCVSAAVVTTYLVAVRNQVSASAICSMLLLAMLASYPRFNPRPDMLSQFLVVPLVLLLAATERGVRDGSFRQDRLLWLLPALILAWANLHALFFLGIAVVVLYGGWRLFQWRRGRERQHLHALIPCALCLVVWVLNPYGVKLLTFIYDNVTLADVGKRVFELKPLLTSEIFSGGIPLHLLIALSVLFGWVGLIGWTDRGSISGWRVIAIIGFIALALYQRRQIGLAAAALPALVVSSLAAQHGKLGRGFGIVGVIALLMVTIILRLVGVLEISRGVPRAGVDCEWFPCGAAQFLKKNPPPDNLFHDLYTGGYLAHELEETKTFIDGRLEVFKGQVWEDYFGPPDGRSTLDDLFGKYDVQTCLLDIRGARGNPGHTANRLAGRADWQLVYFDDQYAAFVKRDESSEGYLERHGYALVNPLNWNALGEALQVPQNHSTALVEARRAVEVAPNSASAHAAMAMVSYTMGRKSDGDLHLKRAQAIDPTVAIGPPN